MLISDGFSSVSGVLKDVSISPSSVHPDRLRSSDHSPAAEGSHAEQQSGSAGKIQLASLKALCASIASHPVSTLDLPFFATVHKNNGSKHGSMLVLHRVNGLCRSIAVQEHCLLLCLRVNEKGGAGC